MKKLYCAAALIFFLWPAILLAVSENTYEDTFRTDVAPYFDMGERGSFAGEDGIRINYIAFERDDEAGALVILHGMCESYIKYAELVYDLRDLGLSVYLMDHRGFGFSERLAPDVPSKVYVHDFDNYVADLKTFVDTVVNRKPHDRLLLIAHSMGGGIAARYLELYPSDVTAAVLSAPMLQLHTQEYPEVVAYLLTVVNKALGNGTGYAPGQGPPEECTFIDNTVTHSYKRWANWELNLKADCPDVISGGITYNWIKECMEAVWMARADAPSLTTPVLLFQADEDTYVKPAGQDDLCEQAADCSKIFFHGARHEILMEVDAIRDIALDYIKSFFSLYIDT